MTQPSTAHTSLGSGTSDSAVAVVMFSGGIGSWAAARRTVERHPDTRLLFTDVGGDHSTPHLGEDEDTYRFLHDAAADIGAPLTVLNDGRNIYDVFREKRWLGNASLSHCSWELKTKPARRWMEERFPDPSAVVVVIGIDWTETHRLAKVIENWQPYTVEAPMTEKPYLGKLQMIDAAKQRGLRPPRMYSEGFAHSNCLGCVKAGQAHWERVLRQRPDTFAYHEQREQEMRELLGDVAILRDRTGGESTPLPLREFRQRIDAGRLQLDLFDEGGCGCFLEAA